MRNHYDTYFMVKILRSEVKDNELEDFKKQLERSEKNRKKFEELKKLWEILDAVNVSVDDPNESWALIKEKIEKERIKILVKEYVVKFVKRRVYILGLVLLLVGFVYAFFKFYEGVGFRGNNYVSYEVGRGQIGELILPDSTVVTLNSLSKIVYPLRFSFDGRVVYLDGEAYFRVRSNLDTLFYVKTGDIKTIVIGTSFNIRYRNGTYSLYVDTGSVIVIDEKRNHVLKVSAGESVIATSDVGIKEAKKDKRELYVMWMFGEIVFEEERLIDVLKELQNYHDFDFVFERSDLAVKKITGGFNKDVPIDKVLKAIAFSIGADIDITTLEEGSKKLFVKIK